MLRLFARRGGASWSQVSQSMSDGSLFDLQTIAAPATAAGTHSLYRKYRPSTFADDDLVGQEHVVSTLRNAIALDRIAHAYLFCGPRGTGKTTTARLLAKAVNCLDPDPQARPCNTCAACVAITTNATTDVIEIDAASNRGIDDIRDLRERVKYAPTQLKSKFYIIDEAHQITGAAANAFLKTLEEPPAHTRFVLATTDPEELLQTIVSRCQRFDFRRINLPAMISRLRTVADREAIQVDDDALHVIARQATGSLRDALGILDQVAVYRDSSSDERRMITADTVREVLGISRNDRVEALVRALADQDPAAGLQEVAAATEDGDDIRQLGRQLVSYLRVLMLQKAGGNADADETARELAGRLSLEELAGLLRHFADIDFKSKRAALPQLPLEVAIVEGAMCAHVKSTPAQTVGTSFAAPRSVRESLSPAEPPEDLTSPPPSPPSERTRPAGGLRDRVRGTATMSSQRDSPPPPPPPDDAPRVSDPLEPAVRMSAPIPTPGRDSSTPTAAGGNELEALMDAWQQIKSDVKAVNRRIEALLQQADPAAVNPTHVTIVSPYEFHRNKLNSDDVRRVVEDAVGRTLGRSVQVSFVSREDLQAATARTTSSPRTAVEASAPPASAEPVHDDPAVDVAPAPAFDAREIEERLTAARNIFDAEEIT
jgi:DNA polymerase III subunit gamma/tau